MWLVENSRTETPEVRSDCLCQMLCEVKPAGELIFGFSSVGVLNDLNQESGEANASVEGPGGGWEGRAMRTSADEMERTNVHRSPKGFALKENEEMRQYKDRSVDEGG